MLFVGLVAAAGVATIAASSAATEQRLPPGGRVVASITVPGASGSLAVGKEAVWALNRDASTLFRIDPAQNKVVARIKIRTSKPCPTFPQTCGVVAAGEGAVWVVKPSEGTVLRVTGAANTVAATIHTGPHPAAIAVSAGNVWIADLSRPTLTRIDARSNSVVTTIKLGRASACCLDHVAVAASGGAVWTTLAKANVVVRVDPTRNAVASSVRLSYRSSGGPCGFLAIDSRAVWVASASCPTLAGSGILTLVDPRTSKAVATVPGFQTPVGLATGFGSLWVSDLDLQAIYRVNQQARRIVASVPVGGVPIEIATGFGSLWVADATGRILRIQPS